MPIDPEIIKKILLGRGTQDDKLIWHFDDEGSVKLCYKMGSLEYFREITSISSYLKKWWYGMWRLVIQPKFKKFSSSEFIIRPCLLKRKFAINPSCCHCTKAKENTICAMFECKVAGDS